MTNEGENKIDYDSWSDNDYEEEDLTPGFLRPLTEAEKPGGLARWNDMVETYNETETRKAKANALASNQIGTLPDSLSPVTQSKKGSSTSGVKGSSSLVNDNDSPSTSHKTVEHLASHMHKILQQIKGIAVPYNQRRRKPVFEEAKSALERIMLLCEQGLQETTQNNK